MTQMIMMNTDKDNHSKILFNHKQSASSAFHLFILVLFLSGCQKVVNIDLNSASPAIVIEGNINDQPGPYIVTISHTVNFSNSNYYPPVSGAFVTLSDNVGTIDTLSESPSGTYKTKKIMGVSGRTYTLKVISNAQTYTATSTMPKPVTFDTLLVVPQLGLKDTNLYAQVGFRDPDSVVNYYRFREAVNYTVKPDIFVLDDENINGKNTNYVLIGDSTLKAGEIIAVEMQCIDKGTYQYFNTFNEAEGATNLTPSNPISNISNNALGYFSAHTSEYKGLIVP